MTVQRRIGRHRVGSWDFYPASGELRRRANVRRLEPRAARVLEMLCDADGGVVGHDALIRDVWDGRNLSENSVAVVIGQLRRALGDDDKRLIENVPKRGYRLSSGPAAPGERRHGNFRRKAALLLVPALAAGAGAAILVPRGPSLPDVAVADVANETGDPALGPHARATSELIVNELSRRGFVVRRGGRGSDFVLRPRLVMWDGKPFLGITATSPDGVVRWSAMVPGSPAETPQNARAALGRFQAEVSSR